MIPLGIVETLKETKNVLEDENDKKVRTSTGDLLKDKEIPKDEKVKRVSTYSDVVSTKET